MSRLRIKTSGVWRDIVIPRVKTSNVWRDISLIRIKTSNVWRDIAFYSKGELTTGESFFGANGTWWSGYNGTIVYPSGTDDGLLPQFGSISPDPTEVEGLPIRGVLMYQWGGSGAHWKIFLMFGAVWEDSATQEAISKMEYFRIYNADKSHFFESNFSAGGFYKPHGGLGSQYTTWWDLDIPFDDYFHFDPGGKYTFEAY